MFDSFDVATETCLAETANAPNWACQSLFAVVTSFSCGLPAHAMEREGYFIFIGTFRRNSYGVPHAATTRLNPHNADPGNSRALLRMSRQLSQSDSRVSEQRLPFLALPARTQPEAPRAAQSWLLQIEKRLKPSFNTKEYATATAKAIGFSTIGVFLPDFREMNYGNCCE